MGVLKPLPFEFLIEPDVVMQRQKMNGVFPYGDGKSRRFHCGKIVPDEFPQEFRESAGPARRIAKKKEVEY